MSLSLSRYDRRLESLHVGVDDVPLVVVVLVVVVAVVFVVDGEGVCLRSSSSSVALLAVGAACAWPPRATFEDVEDVEDAAAGGVAVAVDGVLGLSSVTPLNESIDVGAGESAAPSRCRDIRTGDSDGRPVAATGTGLVGGGGGVARARTSSSPLSPRCRNLSGEALAWRRARLGMGPPSSMAVRGSTALMVSCRGSGEPGRGPAVTSAAGAFVCSLTAPFRTPRGCCCGGCAS